MTVIETLKGGLIVSCQALRNEPLFGAGHMAAMAKAVAMGGAAGIRANSGADIAAIKAVVSIPVIGLVKKRYNGSDVYITPTLEEVTECFRAGADIIAIDATRRRRPGDIPLEELIARARQLTGRPILADVSTLEEGFAAQQAGADAVSTALAGYTSYSRQMEGPDLELVSELARELSIPVFAEGRIWTPEEAVEALKRGAFAVVVGSAITRPQLITRRFTRWLERAKVMGYGK